MNVVVTCIGPLVAIIVIVDIVTFAAAGRSLAPQPLHTLSPNAASASISICKPRRFFLPKRQSPNASAEAGNQGVRLRCKAAVDVDVVIVRAVEAARPAGVTVAGEKLHDAPEGKPAQLNVIGAENEFWGVTMTVTVAPCPAVRESELGEAATKKVGVAASVVLMV